MNGFQVALILLEKGVQCIPLNQMKTPLFSFKDKPITPGLIENFRYQYANALCMGILTRGLWCIDIDRNHEGTDNGFESIRTIPFYDELDQNAKGTMLQSTPSGGMHLIFRKKEGITYQQKISYLPGVDIKANENNYFVMAGSVTVKGIYTRNDLAPAEYQGKFEERIFSEGATFRKQIELKYGVRNTMPEYNFSHSFKAGNGGLGKLAYQRIIEGISSDRNNDLFLAATYAKTSGVAIQPLMVLIGTRKGQDIFTENEFWKTVESAGSR